MGFSAGPQAQRSKLVVQERYIRGARGPRAFTETADHPDAELPFKPLPQPDGNVCHDTVLLQPEAPSGDHCPSLRPDLLSSLQVKVNLFDPQCSVALGPLAQDDLSPLDYLVWVHSRAAEEPSANPEELIATCTVDEYTRTVWRSRRSGQLAEAFCAGRGPVSLRCFRVHSEKDCTIAQAIEV